MEIDSYVDNLDMGFYTSFDVWDLLLLFLNLIVFIGSWLICMTAYDKGKRHGEYIGFKAGLERRNKRDVKEIIQLANKKKVRKKSMKKKKASIKKLLQHENY